jgi:hypothetical protein
MRPELAKLMFSAMSAKKIYDNVTCPSATIIEKEQKEVYDCAS